MELDLAKPLVPHDIVRGEKMNLEYKGLHSICFTCGVYGHRMENCSVKKVRVAVLARNGSDTVVQAHLQKDLEKRPTVGEKGVECPTPLPVAANLHSRIKMGRHPKGCMPLERDRVR